MTGRVRGRRALRRDAGFSVILSAMLLLGMVMTAYVTYQSSVVPVLQAEEEARHLRAVVREMIQLKGDLDRQLQNDSTGPVVVPISLGRERASMFATEETAGALAFEPGTRSATLWVNKLLIQEDNATSLLGHPESWLDMQSGLTSIEDVNNVVSFRVKLDQVSRDNEGDHIVVRVTDADGAAAGDFRVCVARHAPDWDIHVRVRDAMGTVIQASAEPYFNTQSYAPYWIDLMDPEYRFDRLLSTTKGPMDFELEVQNDQGEFEQCPGEGGGGTGSDDLEASFAITYFEKSEEGLILRGSGGVTKDDVRRNHAGGALVYTSDNLAASRQEILIENGAIVLDQGDGAVFRAHPHIRVALVNNIVNVHVHLASLIGTSNAITGTSTAAVSVLPGPTTSFFGQASNMTLRLETHHPQLWAASLRAELEAAGLDEGTHFDLVTGSNWVSVAIWGVLDTSPASETYDLALRFARVGASVRLDT